jgi:ribosome-associated translation inhibitor RaiA
MSRAATGKGIGPVGDCIDWYPAALQAERNASCPIDYDRAHKEAAKMPVELHTPRTRLSPDSEKRIQRHIAGLERRLVNFANPLISITIKDRVTERRHTADIRLQLGVDGVELLSHNDGESAEHAARLAIEDIERQLERYMSTLRGEATYGTPSRREPRDLRPGMQPAEESEEGEENEESDLTDEDDYDAPPDLTTDERDQG